MIDRVWICHLSRRQRKKGKTRGTRREMYTRLMEARGNKAKFKAEKKKKKK